MLRFLTAAAVLLAVPAMSAQAQEPSAAAVAQPDFSGLWVISNRSLSGNRDERFEPLKPQDYLTPAAQEAVAKMRPAYDPSALCLPALPRQIPGPYPIEIVQRPGRVAMLFEWDTVFRLIYTDGRPHPDADEDQRFMGHAIGRFEDGRLVVDTTNFNGKTWLEGSGVPMSQQARLSETYELQDGGKTMVVTVKVEDPVNLTRPIFRRHVFNRKDDWALAEYVCAEGNRDNVFQQREGQPGSLEENDVIEAP
ncbi:hypothetical protein [Tsuneonella sp. HG222]